MRVRLPWKKKPAQDEVISWLRSPEGERWAEARIGGLHHHWAESGAFADVFPDPGGQGRAARWPEPYYSHELNRLDG